MPKLPTTAAGMHEFEVGRPDILLERGINAEHSGCRDAAIRLFRQALKIDPTNVAAMNCLGAAVGESGDLFTAIQQFSNSLRIEPMQPEIWFNLGIGQSKLGLTEEALKSFDRSLTLAPRSGLAHLQRASTLSRLGRYQEALEAFDETVRVLPHDTVTAKQRGLALQWCGKYEAAFREFDRALALDPDHAEAWVSKAMLMMMLGDLPGGFALYEWRWRMAVWVDSPRRLRQVYTQPLWLGESNIAGKTILIHTEQGFGDVFQFCRYTGLAAKAGARVIVEVEPGLMALMATLPGVSQVVSDREPLPDHDFRCPMMSLPLAFGTTLDSIPAEVPYLRADPARVADWRERLAGLRGCRIGLVWGAGSRVGDAELVALEHRKTLPLQALAPLADVVGCDFVSVQVGTAAKQAASPPAGMILHDHTELLNDFGDTAALMENLDLVISVCTSTAHLAGALGRPVWLLNRFDTDWRWFLNRADSPWYPTMRIFRQPQPGDWDSVVRSIVGALRDFVAAPA
jgi:tetratricopeptide (TPR) repeat protein